MTDLINLLTSKEIIVVYIVVGVACFLYFLIYLIDKSYYKRKQRQNTRELNKLVEDINIQLEKENIDTNIKEEIKQEESVMYIEPVLIESENKENEISDLDVNKEVKEVEKIEPIIVEEDKPEIPVLEELIEEKTIEDLKIEEAVSNSENEIKYTAIEPNPKEAQEELRRLTEELEKAEEETRNIDLTSYEEAQERDAIISLDELIKKSKEMYANNEITQYEDEGNEPISLADLEKKYAQSLVTEIEQEKEVIEPVLIEQEEKEPIHEQLAIEDFENIKIEEKRPVYQETFKYKPSPIISPIYGIEKTVVQTDIELENTANYEKLDEEIKKTNEFLMTLKELQKHLE